MRTHPGQARLNPLDIFRHIIPMIPVGVQKTLQDLGESRPIMSRHRREIGPDVERLLNRREEHSHRPAAPPP